MDELRLQCFWCRQQHYLCLQVNSYLCLLSASVFFKLYLRGRRGETCTRNTIVGPSTTSLSDSCLDIKSTGVGPSVEISGGVSCTSCDPFVEPQLMAV